MASKSGKGRGAQDAIDSLHTDNSLTDREKRSLQDMMMDALVMYDSTGVNADRTFTFTYSLFRGANPSLSFSVTT